MQNKGIWLITDGVSRAISPENPTGQQGMGAKAKIGEGSASFAAQHLGEGWKVNPYIQIQTGETRTIAEINGSGMITHIWMTLTEIWRYSIIRIYWDGSDTPSVECPVADFFAMGWNRYAPVVSEVICVNPGSAFNCYWKMPFQKQCRITMENLGEKEIVLFYQIDYELCRIPENAGYFCASFHREKLLADRQVYPILEGVKAAGQYVGTYLAWGVHHNGWWGEGEVKFYLDEDDAYPTICGTGTEDYFCGSYNFENQHTHQYESFLTPYAGLCQVIRPDGLYDVCQRFGMYRWHLPDPVRFRKGIKVTVQALGWREGGYYLPLRDDISSVAYWYQDKPLGSRRQVLDRELLEIN